MSKDIYFHNGVAWFGAFRGLTGQERVKNKVRVSFSDVQSIHYAIGGTNPLI